MAYTDIDKPSDFMNVVTYTGNGAERTISGVNFQPGMTFIKSRSNGQDQSIEDSVRGAQKQLSTIGEQTETTYGQYVKSFNSDGFVLGTDAQINQNSQTFVSWNFKKDAASGFDIIGYEGNGQARTIAHGLNSAPRAIVVKARDVANRPWCFYHVDYGNTNTIFWNTAASGGSYDDWNNTHPTSSVFSLKGNPTNTDGGNHIAYMWADVQGCTKVSSYIGNGDANGPFVYLGFKPAFLLIKNTAAQPWNIYDNKRDGINPNNPPLLTHADTAEGADGLIDLLSNGFKIRNSVAALNESAATMLYVAMAENPFVTSTGIPATAR